MKNGYKTIVEKYKLCISKLYFIYLLHIIINIKIIVMKIQLTEEQL